MTTLVGGHASTSDQAVRAWNVLTSQRFLRRSAAVTAAAAIIALDAHLISPYIASATVAVSHPIFGWVAIALAAEIVSLLASAHLQRNMLRASGTLVSLPTVIGVTYAAYAMSMSLPAGPAMSAGYTFRRLRQLGASLSTAGFTLITSGLLSTLAYGLLAVTGFTVTGGASGGPVALVIGLVASALLILLTRSLLRHPEILERVGLRVLHAINRVLRRTRDAGTPELQRSTRLLAEIHPRSRDWAAGLTAAMINWVADLGCLYASCRAVGASNSTIGVVLLAYLAGTSVSGISLVPGGLGVVDAAVIVVLVQNGLGTATAAAAVLMYRVLSFGFGIVAGWSAWIAHAHAVHHTNEMNR